MKIAYNLQKNKFLKWNNVIQMSCRPSRLGAAADLFLNYNIKFTEKNVIQNWKRVRFQDNIFELQISTLENPMWQKRSEIQCLH